MHLSPSCFITTVLTPLSLQLFALLTGGEGNHNFHVSPVAHLWHYSHPDTDYPLQHAFPRDYRASPETVSWDPSKWIIELLYRYSNLVTSVRKADEDDIRAAKASILHGHHHHHSIDADDEDLNADGRLPTWTREETERYINDYLGGTKKRRLVLVDEYLVDMADYTAEHVRLHHHLR